MTDNEIIKALECSPLNDIGGCRKIDALDLINHQKAEIERLEQNINGIDIVSRNHIKVIRTQAIKECAERLKEQSKELQIGDNIFLQIVGVGRIDNLVKEMAGE